LFLRASEAGGDAGLSRGSGGPWHVNSRVYKERVCLLYFWSVKGLHWKHTYCVLRLDSLVGKYSLPGCLGLVRHAIVCLVITRRPSAYKGG
jgi:hypothetical protein